MDIYQALAADHRELEPLLDELVATSEHNDRTKTILESIKTALIPHSRAEEAVFYNSLRAIDATKDVAAHSYGEHMKAEATLQMLRGLEIISVEWTAAASKLRQDLLHHIAEEEGKVFALARQVLLEEEAVQMASAFHQAKHEAMAKGDLKNTLDLIANLMPKRFSDSTRKPRTMQI